jgi:hypothetical protein
MYNKNMIWLGMIVGSLIGTLIPTLFGASMFSFTSTLCTAIGGGLGIWVAFKYLA